MSRRAPAAVDFETEPIGTRPDGYPPRPVGIAVWEPGRRPRYHAFAHPSGNDRDERFVRDLVRELWRGERPLLFHNSKFDLEVARAHLGAPPLPAAGFHDTLLELFLVDPHADTLSLKPAAELWLGLPAEEEATLRDWVRTHLPEGRGKPRSWRGWGAYIGRCPGDVVRPYAVGDVLRTRRLHDELYPILRDNDLVGAYDRERRLLPHLLEMERAGVPVAYRRLRRDVTTWAGGLERIDAWLRRRLRAPELDVDSNEALADALETAGKVSEWVLTDKGNRSISKANLPRAIDDRAVVDALEYRSRLAHALRTFGRPWLEMAEQSGGYIYTSWNQVRQIDERSGGAKGARTGRLSSNPNFQNITNHHDPPTLPRALRERVPPLPALRDYIVPDRDEILLGRDYSQQEFRILAHYEDGPLLEAYLADPVMDVHDTASELINRRLGTTFARKPVKNTGFGLIYGMGVGKGADAAETDVETFRLLKREYLRQFPGLKDLIRGLEALAAEGEPLRTWGGRLYYCEPPKVVDGRWRTFVYKLLNYLIQGSASDCTKEAIIRYYETPRREGRLLLTAHDELLAAAPRSAGAEEMRRLREAMESIEFDVPMRSEGEWSRRSWARMKPWHDDR